MIPSRKRLVVIGGGAAGFFCAVNAARLNPELEVMVLEKTSKLLSKVKVSGGGRCNVTHACFDIGEMSKKYPRGRNFVKKTFHQFFTSDMIHWLEERGVKLKAEADGRMFPVTDSSQTIIDCLLREADKYAVQVRTKTEVRSLEKEGDRFQLQVSSAGDTGDLRLLTTDFICVACGGYPKAALFSWLTATGHSVEEPVPSLFTFNLPGHAITRLMGVSVENVRIKIAGSKLEQEGPLLITHWGLSGPAVLKLSAWGARELAARNWTFPIVVNWLPDFSEQKLQEQFQAFRFSLASSKIAGKNPFRLPNRLWDFLLQYSGIGEGLRWADLPARDQHKLVRNISSCLFDVRGKTTFKEEFVTAGGIRLAEIDPNTMQSKLMPHLFFAGEIMDVDGVTGGFNFQHAWTSSYIAALSIAGAGSQ